LRRPRRRYYAFGVARSYQGRALTMAGPSWLAAGFAAVMIVTALYCVGRLAVSRLWRRETELDADAVHVVMGVAMAGMFLPRLSPLPGGAWEAVFGAAAAWFAVQAIRGLRGTPASSWRCSHPVPHLVESAAMIYMLAAPGRGMPGMAGGAPGAGGSLQALAVVLALFMAGYVLWTADQLTSLARATVGRGTPDRAGSPAARPAGGSAGRPALAPALAACSKIAMGVTMGYMLLVTL
jgi:hypothetical protein